MHLGYNMIGWHESLIARRWDYADNKHIEMVFNTGYIPGIQLIYYTTASAATFQIYDAFTDVALAGTYNLVVLTTSVTNMKYLKYIATNPTGLSEGYYYIVITIGGVQVLFSDVFGWKTDKTGYLGFEITGTDILLGQFYALAMSGFTYKGYLYAENGETEHEITEEGVEKPYGNVPIYNTRNLVNSFEIIGNRAIYEFLSGLRVLETNGTIIFTYLGNTMYARDIVVEKKDSAAFDEALVMTINFKEWNNISSINAV